MGNLTREILASWVYLFWGGMPAWAEDPERSLSGSPDAPWMLADECSQPRRGD